MISRHKQYLKISSSTRQSFLSTLSYIPVTVELKIVNDSQEGDNAQETKNGGDMQDKAAVL